MLKAIKFKLILTKIFSNIPHKKVLYIVHYNKHLQKGINISIDSYINNANKIKLEIILDQKTKNKDKKFININSKKEEPFYHIYFDERKEEIKKNYIRNEKVSKIKIVIDFDIKSIEHLFDYCYYIKDIKFIRFLRTDLKSYKSMFELCTGLINLDISLLKTDNVENMNSMFSCC